MRLVFRTAAIVLFGLTQAQAGSTTIEFNADPNPSSHFLANGFGSNAAGTPHITVTYSPEIYFWSDGGYGGLGGGTGTAVYSDNKTSNPEYNALFAFTASAGYTVTLDSFNLAEYSKNTDAVNIITHTVNRDGSNFQLGYQLTGVTPAGGTGNFSTYSPNETAETIYLAINNLYNVGINEITITEKPEPAAVPEPSSLILASFGGLAILGTSLRRRLRAKAAA